MKRRFTPWDSKVINKEFLGLPKADFLALTDAMKGFQLDTGISYRIDSYGEGIMMITDSGQGQGRGLFFAIENTGEEEELIMLRVYKKESRKAPPHEISLAKARREMYRRGKKD